jgi:hypothetical protein
MAQIELYDKVQVKALLSEGDDTFTVAGKSYDKEGNVMFELEDEDGFLLEDVFYPSQLIKIQEND